MLTLGAAKVLGRGHQQNVARLLSADPVAHCVVAARFEQVGMDRAGLGGSFWGLEGGDAGLVFDGINLVPLTGDADSMATIGSSISRRSRRCASVLGKAELVLPLWRRLERRWGPAREVRPDQPLLALTGSPLVESDPFVRQARPAELGAYFPAAVAMFTEEVGVDPTYPDGGAGYRSRIASLIDGGYAFVRFDGDRVAFKAEIGALSNDVALIQGVWVDPDLRGRGLAAPAMATLCRHIQAMGRIPSLYVNAHNVAARATYYRVGFTQLTTFATVLF